MLPTENVSNMPAPAQAAIRASRLKFIEADRGHVRHSNDKSIDTRSKFFAGWLQSHGHTQQSVAVLDPEQVIDTLGAFLEDVKSGKNLQNIQLSGQSLRNYVTAAALFFKLLTGTMPQYFDAATLSQKKIYLHPYLHEKISQRTVWTKPTLQKEPFTHRMLLAHARTHLTPVLKGSTKQFCGLHHVVWDWLRLGVFTGSRVAEYAQTNLKKHQRFQTIPSGGDAGKWAGQPLAFTQADFTFYTRANCCVRHEDLLRTHKKRNIYMVHIRFRFDKSQHNFTIRKFQMTADVILNPVDAAISIIRRADMLRVPLIEPVGVYSPPWSDTYNFLRDYHITPILRAMCVLAYPDPTHYLRIHIKRLVPHSNRVTAAVCLKMGGATDEEIAFRLRWNVASVPTYLRECFQEVGPIMASTLQGALKTS
jgi:hypothetical protein